MARYTVGKAIVSLHVADIGARRGYPGRLMGHLTDTAVAVNLHKVSPEGISLVAMICVPMNKGVYACEDMAKKIEQVWIAEGAAVTYGTHTFDGKSGMYLLPVYGYWPDTTEETQET